MNKGFIKENGGKTASDMTDFAIMKVIRFITNSQLCDSHKTYYIKTFLLNWKNVNDIMNEVMR